MYISIERSTKAINGTHTHTKSSPTMSMTMLAEVNWMPNWQWIENRETHVQYSTQWNTRHRYSYNSKSKIQTNNKNGRFPMRLKHALFSICSIDSVPWRFALSTFCFLFERRWFFVLLANGSNASHLFCLDFFFIFSFFLFLFLFYNSISWMFWHKI